MTLSCSFWRSMKQKNWVFLKFFGQKWWELVRSKWYLSGRWTPSFSSRYPWTSLMVGHQKRPRMKLTRTLLHIIASIFVVRLFSRTGWCFWVISCENSQVVFLSPENGIRDLIATLIHIDSVACFRSETFETLKSSDQNSNMCFMEAESKMTTWLAAVVYYGDHGIVWGCEGPTLR